MRKGRNQKNGRNHQTGSWWLGNIPAERQISVCTHVADVFKEEFQMTEARFKAHVVSLASMSGISSDLIRFEADKEEGKLMARLAGILIIGNSVSNKVTVCFGSGHKAMAVI